MLIWLVKYQNDKDLILQKDFPYDKLLVRPINYQNDKVSVLLITYQSVDMNN